MPAAEVGCETGVFIYVGCAACMVDIFLFRTAESEIKGESRRGIVEEEEAARVNGRDKGLHQPLWIFPKTHKSGSSMR